MKLENLKLKKISIIVAIYNVEKFLKKCIESIVDQDYENLEIILLDDCSTDSSPIICNDFSKIDSRIKVIHLEKNSKQSTVRNIGIDNATGEYIVFVDGDDWLAKDFASYMLNLIVETNSDMAINLNNFTTNDYKQVKKEKKIIWTPEKATIELLFPHISIGAWNKIYKTSFIKEKKLKFNPKILMGEGELFITTASQLAKSVGVGTRKVYYYRLNNSNSATTKYDVKGSLNAIYATELIKESLIIKTKKTVKAINHHIWYNHFWNLRQITALKKEEEYKDEYLKSFKYVKKNAFSSIINEPSFKKKVNYFAIWLFPIIMAKFLNYKIDNRLKKTIKKENI